MKQSPREYRFFWPDIFIYLHFNSFPPNRFWLSFSSAHYLVQSQQTTARVKFDHVSDFSKPHVSAHLKIPIFYQVL